MGICSLNICQTQTSCNQQVSVKVITPKSKEPSISKESNTTLSTTKCISPNTRNNNIIPINASASKHKMSPDIKRNTPIINLLNKRKRSFSPSQYRNLQLKKHIE